jgi:Arc/MetJ-type ribon-helix-helix transcriptional regulator
MSPVISAKVSEELKSEIDEATETDETRSEAVRRMLRRSIRDEARADEARAKLLVTDPLLRLVLNVTFPTAAVLLVAWRGRKGALLVATVIVLSVLLAAQRRGGTSPAEEDPELSSEDA